MFPQPVTPHGSEGQRFPMAPWGALCSCWESTDAFCGATSQKNGTLSKFTPLHSQPRLGKGSLKVMPTVPIQKKRKKKRHFFQLLEQSRQSHPCLKNAIQIWSAICGMFSPRVKYFCFLGKEFMPITAWLSQRSRYSRYHFYHTTVRWQSWAERSVLNKSVVLTEMVVVTGSM